MQLQQDGKQVRIPTMLIRRLDDQGIAVRFWNIGGRSQFLTLLQRFRGEFLLARPAKLHGLDWLILMDGQFTEVQEFCRRYGIQISQEV